MSLFLNICYGCQWLCGRSGSVALAKSHHCYSLEHPFKSTHNWILEGPMMKKDTSYWQEPYKHVANRQHKHGCMWAESVLASSTSCFKGVSMCRHAFYGSAHVWEFVRTLECSRFRLVCHDSLGWLGTERKRYCGHQLRSRKAIWHTLVGLGDHSPIQQV